MSFLGDIGGFFKKISKAIPLKKTLRAFAPALSAIPVIGVPLAGAVSGALALERKLTNKDKGAQLRARAAGVQQQPVSVMGPPLQRQTAFSARQLGSAFGLPRRTSVPAITPRSEQQLRPIIRGEATFAVTPGIPGAFEQARKFFAERGRTPPPPIKPPSSVVGGAMGFGALIPTVGRAIATRALGGVGRIGIATTTTGVIRGVGTASGFVTRRRMVQLAKTIGLEAAAAALGITIVQLAQAVGDEQRRPRRRRGLSGRDIATTRRTIRMIKSMACAAGISTTAVARRRKTCRS